MGNTNTGKKLRSGLVDAVIELLATYPDRMLTRREVHEELKAEWPDRSLQDVNNSLAWALKTKRVVRILDDETGMVNYATPRPKAS